MEEKWHVSKLSFHVPEIQIEEKAVGLKTLIKTVVISPK